MNNADLADPIETTHIDTDSEAIRIIRARNQMKLYDTLESPLNSMQGESVVERFFRIREILFPKTEFQSIDEENSPANQLINRHVEVDDMFYPRIEESASELLPSLYKLIDQVYEEVSEYTDVQRKEESALKLVSVLYCLGIMIHPSSNGNGQTFKMLIVSYLHELSQKYKDRYMPLKFTHRFRAKEHEFSSFANSFTALKQEGSSSDSTSAANTTVALSTLLAGRNNPNIRLIKDYILENPIDLSLTDDYGKYVLDTALRVFEYVEQEIIRLLTNDSISSEDSIRKQGALAERYAKILPQLEEIRRTDSSAWSDITFEIYVSPKYKDQEKTLIYLEREIRKYRSGRVLQ